MADDQELVTRGDIEYRRYSGGGAPNDDDDAYDYRYTNLSRVSLRTTASALASA